MLAHLGPRFRRRTWGTGLAIEATDAERVSDPAASTAPPITFDPELFPPAGSRSLVLTDQQPIGGAGTQLVLPNLGVQLDKGFGAVIRQMNIFADAPDLATRASWRILIDGAPAPGVGAFTMLFRAASSLSTPFDTLRVRVPQGARIDVAVINIDGVPRVFGAQLVGWTFRLEKGQR